MIGPTLPQSMPIPSKAFEESSIVTFRIVPWQASDISWIAQASTC